MEINKKQDYASLRIPLLGYPSKKEMSIKSALSFSAAVGMRSATQTIKDNQ